MKLKTSVRQRTPSFGQKCQSTKSENIYQFHTQKRDNIQNGLRTQETRYQKSQIIQF